MANKRVGISDKIRFEVFKRDKFTCQYCGRSAPDVVLHVDHIHPVSKGGTNDIVNLITSCRDCNLGKKDRLLTESDEVKKSMNELKDLQEKREQLDLLLKWKEESSQYAKYEVDSIYEYFISKYKYNKEEIDENRDRIKSWLLRQIKSFSPAEIIEAIDAGSMSYDNYKECLMKIGGICKNRREEKEKPWVYPANYIRKVLWSNNLRLDKYICIDYAEKQIKTEEDFEIAKSRLWEVGGKEKFATEIAEYGMKVINDKRFDWMKEPMKKSIITQCNRILNREEELSYRISNADRKDLKEEK